MGSVGVNVDLYTAERLSRIQHATAEAGLDALLLTPGPDLRYVIGYDAKQLERLTCLVVPAERDPFLLVPRLELPAAEASPVAEIGVAITAWGETEDPYEIVARRLPDRVRRVGLADRMWAMMVLRLRAVMPEVEQVAAGAVLRALRMRKSPHELAALSRAAAAIDRVHEQVPAWLRPGRTEREVARDIAEAILDEHAQVDFVIVGSGPHSASPHHEVSDRPLGPGDIIVVDIGGTTPEGYCSDETRTYAIGDPPGDFAAYYEVLRRAQQAACDAVRPGVAPEAVDAAARDIIDEAGYGEFFVHRTGHGIGVETHEDPYIVAGNTEPLERGMTFSIEPGIYIPGQHGARIEDIVCCVEDEGERLNAVSRELVVVEP